jgi:transcriptional regulator with XRE-family HTH domain
MSTVEDFQRERETYLQGFAANVRRLRAEHAGGSLSQSDLYNKADLHRTEVGRIEQAETEPRLMTLVILADALGASLDDLVKGLPVPKERRPPPLRSRQELTH